MSLDAPIPRLVGPGGLDPGRLLELVSGLVALLTLPAPERTDAVAVMTGQGETWRLTRAIELWEADPAVRHLLVANANPAEDTYRDITAGYLRGLGLRRLDGVRIQPAYAPHTAAQADWLADEFAALGVRDVALVVSPYHLPRAYLTVLRAMDRRGVRVPLFPAPVPVPPGRAVPETGATAYDLLPGEIHRMLRYADAGWVATPGELREYLDWMWAGPGR